MSLSVRGAGTTQFYLISTGSPRPHVVDHTDDAAYRNGHFTPCPEPHAADAPTKHNGLVVASIMKRL
jgi:hypothetical protein